ncbi:hypothetical protein FACS189434_06490 [Bacteroidia bacterium]|nr:hypothetical protein FACS189434_06490 [Bacteroidia bacterium]
MRTLIFVYTHDLIQKAVKLETSLLAERRDVVAKEGEVVSNFETLVMDEEYDILFRRLFLQAHAEFLSKIPARYLRETPTDLLPMFREFPDFRRDRDFNLFLAVSDDFPMQYKKSIDIKIEQFLIDYICWRWFETKLPRESATYFARIDKTADEVKDLLSASVKPIKRVASFP